MHNGSFKEVGLSSRYLLEVVLMKDETFTKDYDVPESIHFLNTTNPLLFWPVRDTSWGYNQCSFLSMSTKVSKRFVFVMSITQPPVCQNM